MHQLKNIFFFSFFLVSLQSAFAQQKQFRIPFLQTHNSKKLALALTEGLSSDSSRIYAIHYWITHHIKYDVKKFRAFNYEHLSTKKILRRRKCTCVGYSDLLDELCSYSGLKSVSVPGYVKSQYVDLGDKCYLESHVWNAVYVNEKWELIDPTWDAGYISNRKTSAFRILMHKISFKLVKSSKVKMHFVKSPSEVFYLKPGKYFISTHLPINPMWQNLPSTISVSQFENDSAFYLKKCDETPDTFFIDKNSAAKFTHYQWDEKEKEKSDGYAAFTFNNRNYYQLGIAYELSALDLAENILPESTDTLAQVRLCNNTIELLNHAKISFVKNDSLLHVQNHELLDRNGNKRAIFKKVNDRFVRSTSRVAIAYSRYKHMHKSFKKSAQGLVNKNHHQAKKLKEIKFFGSRISRTPSAIKDSIRIDSLLNLNSGKIKNLNSAWRQTSITVDSIYKEIILKLERNDSIRSILRNAEAGILSSRMEFYDDLDYEIQRSRDTILRKKLLNDSLLFIHDTSLLRYFFYTLPEEKRAVSNLLKTERERLTLLRNKKTCCVNFQPIADEFSNTVEAMISVLDKNSQRQTEFINHSINIKNHSRLLLKILKREKKLYRREKKVESDNSEARADYFKAKLKSLIHVNKKTKTEITELSGKIEKVKRSFGARLAVINLSKE